MTRRKPTAAIPQKWNASVETQITAADTDRSEPASLRFFGGMGTGNILCCLPF
jgi:hypothetical protein